MNENDDGAITHSDFIQIASAEYSSAWFSLESTRALGIATLGALTAILVASLVYGFTEGPAPSAKIISHGIWQGSASGLILAGWGTLLLFLFEPKRPTASSQRPTKSRGLTAASAPAGPKPSGGGWVPPASVRRPEPPPAPALATTAQTAIRPFVTGSGITKATDEILKKCKATRLWLLAAIVVVVLGVALGSIEAHIYVTNQALWQHIAPFVYYSPYSFGQ